MTIFEFLTVAISFVLGLGITHLLSASIFVFRNRDQLRPHWIPAVWATAVFLFQLQYWWALFELSDVITVWTARNFVALLGGALLLFVPSALALPTRLEKPEETLLENFDRNGKWSLVFLAVYPLYGIWVNRILFGTSLANTVNAYSLVLAVLPVIYLAARNVWVRGVATILFLVVGTLTAMEASPSAY